MRRRSLILGAGAAAGSILFAPTVLAQSRARFVGPAPSGSGDGTNWDNRGSLDNLDAFVGQVGPGGVVYVALHLGPYRQTSSLELRNSGAASHPVTIVGVNQNLSMVNPNSAPIAGTRSAWQASEKFNPVNASGFGGNTFLHLGGQSHLVFRNLWLERFEHVFTLSSASNIRFEDIVCYNVRTGWYSDGRSSARNIEIVRPTVVGFSKEAVRFHGTCKDWRIENFHFDSRWQDRDAHARGIYGDDRAVNLVVRRGVIRNCFFSPKDRNGFRQGDGISNEIGNTGWRILDTEITGCTDAGVDLKASDTILERCDARYNKRSYRLWGNETKLVDCVSHDPSTPFEDELRFVRHVWFGSINGKPKPTFEITRLRAAGGPKAMTVFEGYSVGPGGHVNFRNCNLRGLPEEALLTSGGKWTWDGV